MKSAWATKSARARALGLAALAALAVATAGCSSGSSGSPDGGTATSYAAVLGYDGGPIDLATWGETTCAAPAPTACAAPTVRWADVEPIFEQSCTPCHSGAAGGPWPLSQWVDVAAWADSITPDLTNCTMPPLDGGVPMTSGERTAVLGWLACDAPE